MEEFDDATYGWDIKRRIFFITETFISTATFASGEQPWLFCLSVPPLFLPRYHFCEYRLGPFRFHASIPYIFRRQQTQTFVFLSG